MQTKILTSPQSGCQALIYVLPKSEDLPVHLAEIADRSGISSEVLHRDFTADLKENHSFYTTSGQRIFLLGLGEKSDSNAVLQTCRSFVHHQKKLPAHIGIDLTFGAAEKYAVDVLTGFYLGNYNINFYQTSEKKTAPFAGETASIDVIVEKKEAEQAKQAAERARKTADTLSNIFDLINRPANKKRPQDMAAFMVQSGKTCGYSVRVMEKAEIEKTGLHALLAVNRGSEDPARFVIMEYKPKHKKKVPKIGLVGKGVTFDTGGLSIKGSANMHLMKSDMGGSGAVIGAMELVAKLKLPVYLVAVVGATDNSVDALSYKPSDVVNSYVGKTIEIIDTDAEGRLTLADGLAYVHKNYQPDILIDIATLTGAVIRALGYAAAGLFTQNDELARELIRAGNETGEKVWQMPMWDDYKSMIKSDVADVRNFSGKPIAGSITAAKFLEHFTEGHPKWAHLDIAGTSVTANEFATDRSATGFGVRLLLQFIENQIK